MFVEMRRGIHLEDKILQLFPPNDYSLPIFILLYSSIATVVVSHIHKPRVIMRLIEMHLLIAVTRQITILLIALEPPSGLIVLRDIFLENTFYPNSTPLTKDLFFSGHVASLWLYYLITKNPTLKLLHLAGVILMAFMILSMRVHYSYDVYGAILFTTILYKLPYWYKELRPKAARVK